VLLRLVWWLRSTPSMPENNCSHNSYDVVVLGGGPAGAATALALEQLDPALRVALIEKSDYSGVRIGETLPPPARALLTALGIWDAFLATSPLPSYGTRAAWGGPHFHENEFIFSPHGHGWHVNRRAFDAMLVTEAARRVEVIQPATFYRWSRQGDHWLIGIRSSSHHNLPSPQESRENDKEVSARFVVDATGRCSWFASSLGVRPVVYDRLVGIFTFLHSAFGCSLADSYTSIEACEHGWWYSAVLPEGSLALAFMTDAARMRELRWRSYDVWRLLAEQAPGVARQIGAAIPIGKPLLKPAASQRLETCAGEGWLAVGDAASAFDPLSSQGIVKGLHSGICAARTICRYLHGRHNALVEYAQFVDREYDKYLDARAAYYRLEQRWPGSPFWQQRHKKSAVEPSRIAPPGPQHDQLAGEGWLFSGKP
jgi:flavin-dependent dehydrogenase